MKKNFYTLLITLFFISGFKITAQTYNEHDLSKLKSFMEQTSGDKRNIDILWENAPADLDKDGGNWVSGLGEHVRWTNDGQLKYIEGKYKDLSGVINFEGCSGLVEMYLRNNNFTELNVKDCSKLEMLYVCLNQITTFNIEGCYNLREIAASANRDTKIDLSGRSMLTKLYLPANYNLESINLAGCTALKELTFTKGKIKSIDLKDCPNLISLECFGNSITSLDLSKSPKIKTLTLSSADITGSFTNPLTSLNISGCQQLESYDFIASFPNLKTLNISNCGLSVIDISNNTKLTQLEAGNQQLKKEKQTAQGGTIKVETLKNKDITITPLDGGVFAGGFVTWGNLPLGDSVYHYSFTTPLPVGVTGTPFGGTVSVPWTNNEPPVSIIDVKGNTPVVYSVDGRLIVQTEKPQNVQIINLTGQIVKNFSAVTDLTVPLTKGIYIVRIGNGTAQKVIIR